MDEPNNPPYTPNNPDPTNHATDIDIDVDLSWIGGDPDPGDTVTYDVYYGTTNPPSLVINNQTSTTYDPGTMEYNSQYYWKIVSWDDYGESTEGPFWDFTTIDEPNNPPYTPSIPDPEDGETDVTITTDLFWTGGDPDAGDTVTYDVYFGSSNPPPQVTTGQSGSSYDPGTLNYNTAYYWKIVSWDNHGTSTDGPEWDFTTIDEPNNPPYTPTNPDPTNHAIDIYIDVDLSWTGGDPDTGDTVTYDVYFGTNNPPPQETTGQTETTYNPGTLNYEQTYYWKITAWDNHGEHTEGSTWDFTTEEEPNNPPYTPANPIPTNHATEIGIDSFISWTGGDPDAGDTVTYDIYFGTTSPPPEVATGQTDTTYNPGTLNYEQTYYWMIDAYDNHGEHAEGPIWDFTTIEEPNHPPYMPNNPIPSDDAFGVSTSLDLSWSGGDPDLEDTVTYDVYLGTITPPPQIVNNQSETSFNPDLNYNTTYYWRIISWDNHGEHTEGPIWEFMTMEDGQNQPPITPQLSGLSIGGVIVPK